MPNTITQTLADNQSVTVAIAAGDAAGNPTGAVLDAGSVTAGVSNAAITATVSADQTSVLITATGAVVTGDTVTITGSVNAVALTPGVATVDTTASTASTQILLTPGTPA